MVLKKNTKEVIRNVNRGTDNTMVSKQKYQRGNKKL